MNSYNDQRKCDSFFLKACLMFNTYEPSTHQFHSKKLTEWEKMGNFGCDKLVVKSEQETTLESLSPIALLWPKN